MQWTKEKTTRFGTSRERHGTWHGIPYVLRTLDPRGMTAGGWIVVGLVVLLLVLVAVVEELV